MACASWRLSTVYVPLASAALMAATRSSRTSEELLTAWAALESAFAVSESCTLSAWRGAAVAALLEFVTALLRNAAIALSCVLWALIEEMDTRLREYGRDLECPAGRNDYSCATAGVDVSSEFTRRSASWMFSRLLA